MVKNNVVLVPKSRKKRYLGMTLEVKNGFVFSRIHHNIWKKKKNQQKNPVKVALLVFDTVTETHWNIRKRKKSFTKKLGLKSSALVDVDLGEQESSYWNAAGCCWLNWELGCAWAGAPSVRDLGHLLLQLGDALVLVGDRVLDGFQLLQNLVQFGVVLGV